jgi:hypothetical protein
MKNLWSNLKTLARVPLVWVLLLVNTFFVVVGCGQNASTMSGSNAREMVNHITYVKDRYGICYAVVASRTDGDFAQNGFTITYVPCTPQVEAAILRGQ